MKLYTNTNRILSTVLATTLSLSLFASTSSATEAPSFTDSDTFPTWAIPYITDAATLGLVGGYEDGSFKPERTMTVGEFLVMLTNTYPELKELAESSTASYYVKTDNGNNAWYSKYVYAAHKSSLLPVGMSPTTEDMTNGITREEAAYMVYTAMTTLGGEYKTVPLKAFDTSVIKDYTSINDGKRESVVQMYLKGVMSGYDTGAFGPQNELTRAELCVIMLALNEPDRRNPYKEPDTSGTNSNADYPDAVYGPNGEQIITEGSEGYRPLAQAGDIFIDANGNQIVLEVGPSGVVGEGQGVAPDVGKESSMGIVEPGYGYSNREGELDSLGNLVSNQKYLVNNLTGEGHFTREWAAIRDTSSPVPKYEGTLFEVSEDKNWVYMGTDWTFAASSTNLTWERLEELKAAN